MVRYQTGVVQPRKYQLKQGYESCFNQSRAPSIQISASMVRYRNRNKLKDWQWLLKDFYWFFCSVSRHGWMYQGFPSLKASLQVMKGTFSLVCNIVEIQYIFSQIQKETAVHRPIQENHKSNRLLAALITTYLSNQSAEHSLLGERANKGITSMWIR